MGDRLNFGFAAVWMKQGGVTKLYADVVGSFSAEVVPEVVTTMGGAASAPIASRLGRASGEGSITVRERPAGFDQLLGGGTLTSTAAASAPAVGSITNVSGSTISGLTAAAPTTGVHAIDFEVTATGASAVDIKALGSQGVEEVSMAVTSTAQAIGSTGATLLKSSGAADLSAGDVGIFSLTPAHGGISKIAVPQIQAGAYYEVVLISSPGGPDDAIQKYVFPRVFLVNANPALEDMAATGDVELKIVVHAPEDGGSLYTREVIAGV